MIFWGILTVAHKDYGLGEGCPGQLAFVNAVGWWIRRSRREQTDPYLILMQSSVSESSSLNPNAHQKT